MADWISKSSRNSCLQIAKETENRERKIKTQRHRAAAGLQRNLKNKNQVNREANKSKNNNVTFRGPAMPAKAASDSWGRIGITPRSCHAHFCDPFINKFCVPAIKLKSTPLSVCCFGLVPLFRARHDIYVSSVKKRTNGCAYPTPGRFCYIPMLIKKENSCQNLSELLHCISLKPSEALIVWGLTVCRRDIFRVIANASSITKCQ